MKKRSLHPFIKWVGGKSGLIKDIDSKLPIEFKSGNIKKYIEPFVGGGAMLFHVLENYDIKSIYIHDTNKELINTYEVVKNNVNELIKKLNIFQEEYMLTDMEDRVNYFYNKRKEYNKGIENGYEERKVEQASLFIFLNKTCFNGLYRVNSKGLFNVPTGKYKNPNICDRENLLNVSEALQKVIIEHSDYKECAKNVTNNSFVYFDPPYRPISKTSAFVSYSKDDFNDEHQKELASFYNSLDMKGAYLMLSNSNPKVINKEDIFFEEIYEGYNLNEVYAKRFINSDATKRGAISELLITNYEGEESYAKIRVV
ncbi:MAG: DNA adenine methylase [Clostridia bacterium]|nr:DNA adenine methylase [Clostridia bacterium]MDD4387108.1 DNA adenine methylase [Clostridia bacterium]